MNKQFWLKVLNLTIIGLFLWQAFTGIVMFFDFSEVLHNAVQESHGYTGLAFMGAILLHVIFNWTWIRDAYLRFSKPKGN